MSHPGISAAPPMTTTATAAPTVQPQGGESLPAAAQQKPPFPSPALYVGDLPESVDESVLWEIFNKVAPISSIRICRDASTHKSLGYAYINYHNVQDAERAMDTLNYAPIKGVPCRIMWSHRDPSLRKSGSGNVFVKNLDKMVDNKALYDTFSLFGNILSCKVATDETGKSLGYGFVHYEMEESAIEAIEKINGMDIGSKPVYVGRFLKRGERGDSRNTFFTNLYVKHLPDTWTEDTLRAVFGVFGTITSMAINQDPKGRRFAFVNFDERDSARNAVANLHGRRTKPDGIMTEEEEQIAEAEREAGEAEAAASAAAAAKSLQPQPTEDAISKAPSSSIEQQPQQPAGSANEQSATPVSAGLKTVESSEEVQREETTTSPTGSLTTDERHQQQQPDQLPAAKELLADVPENCLYVQRAMSRLERANKLKTAFAASQSTTPGGADSASRNYAVNLYVKNLHEDVDDDALREAFQQFGTITSVRVMRHETGASKGFGFVCFAFPEDATKAVTAMHLRSHRGKPLYVGLAEKREYRVARLQQRYRAGPRVTPQPTHYGYSPMAGGLPMQPVLPMQQPIREAGGSSDPRFPPPYAYGGAAGMAAGMVGVPGSMPPAIGGPNQQQFGAAALPSSMPGHIPLPVAGNQPMLRGSAPLVGAPRMPFAPFPGGMMSTTGPAVGGQLHSMGTPFAPADAAALSTAKLTDLGTGGDPAGAAPPTNSKAAIGEKLYPKVAALQPSLAGKITGMMLEMDDAELKFLLDNEKQLVDKIEEAVGVLARHGGPDIAAAAAATVPKS